MNILVTGGTVFVSRFTAEYFADKGHTVHVLNRGSRPQSKNVTHICCDRHELNDRLKNIRFDAIIDVTAYNSDDIISLTDGLGSFDQYIFISSSAVYPETLPQPFTENAECGANSIWGAYGTDKICAEKELLKRVPDAYILRPPYLYGTMNNVFREAFVFECAELNKPFYVPKDGKMPLQFFSVKDLCRFIERIIELKPEQHIFNVGNPETIDIIQWVRLCYGVIGKEPELKFVSDDVPQRNYFPFYDYAYKLDVSAMLGIMPDIQTLEDGLHESYDWFRQNRELVKRKPLHEYIEKNFGG